MAELVDARDLKSLVTCLRVGSIPTLGTIKIKDLSILNAKVLFYSLRSGYDLSCKYLKSNKKEAVLKSTSIFYFIPIFSFGKDFWQGRDLHPACFV